MDIKELVDLCKKGNEQALSLLYKTYSKKMMGICLHYIPDKQIAQDLLHDGFIVIFTSIETLRTPEKLESWMAFIVFNHIGSHLQRRIKYHPVCNLLRSNTSVTSVVDGVSKTEKQDASGNIISVTDPAGATAYNYRPDGQMNSVIAPGQITTTFGYDDFGRRITMNDPSFGLIEYGYDAMGNGVLETDANGNTTRVYW